MTTVITYGTYDMLHYGHIRLLERAKNLGDYLIVGVTSDDFDRSRGKINVQQSLMERVEALKATGIADQIIIEEYTGQKIDDIRRYNVDIFAIGSDWEGKFDYLKEFCNVVYLERTKGISSTELRAKNRRICLGIVGGGKPLVVAKYINECRYINGLEISGIYSAGEKLELYDDTKEFVAAGGAESVNSSSARLTVDDLSIKNSYAELLDSSNAVYIASYPSEHYKLIKTALEQGKHVLCESPIAKSKKEVEELFSIASRNDLILVEAIKTAYSMAYDRLLLLIKSGVIGEVLAIDATCTSLSEMKNENILKGWNSISTWGPTALLPVFQVLGTDYVDCKIVTKLDDAEKKIDAFTKVSFLYKNSVADIKVGLGMKSEGELIISGTKGYIYVPAPWWKTDYFEVRFEHSENNKRYFYQLDGEGIRFELVDFVKAINTGKPNSYISPVTSAEIANVLDLYHSGKNVFILE